MARIRSLHPGQWTDDAFLTCSPLARLLALALRNEADDSGVFAWKVLQIKVRCLPADNCDPAALLAELVAADLIRRFEVDGKAYGAIRNFQRFQRVERPTATHPLPDALADYVGAPARSVRDGSANDRRTIGERSANGRRGVGDGSAKTSPEVRGERIGKEGGESDAREVAREVARPVKLQICDFEPDPDVGIALGLDPDRVAAEGRRFVAWNRSKGAESADWDESWRLWLERVDDGGRSGGLHKPKPKRKPGDPEGFGERCERLGVGDLLPQLGPQAWGDLISKPLDDTGLTAELRRRMAKLNGRAMA